MTVIEKARLARQAAASLSIAAAPAREQALRMMAQSLLDHTPVIRAENAVDVQTAVHDGLSAAMVRRLELSDVKIRSMASALEQMAAMPDMLGEVIETIHPPNGLEIQKVRVPLGVIGIIYESRPNVTSDAAGICVKSGNAVVPRGGSEALRSNIAIVRALQQGLTGGGLDAGCVQIVETTDRSEVDSMMAARGLIDVIIPRGGAGLINYVVTNSKVPAIETGAGNCHVFVDRTADLETAEAIVVNAKCSNPSVCNAIETLLVHSDVAPRFLPRVISALRNAGVKVRGCERTRAIADQVATGPPSRRTHPHCTVSLSLWYCAHAVYHGRKGLTASAIILTRLRSCHAQPRDSHRKTCSPDR